MPCSLKRKQPRVIALYDSEEIKSPRRELLSTNKLLLKCFFLLLDSEFISPFFISQQQKSLDVKIEPEMSRRTLMGTDSSFRKWARRRSRAFTQLSALALHRAAQGRTQLCSTDGSEVPGDGMC